MLTHFTTVIGLKLHSTFGQMLILLPGFSSCQDFHRIQKPTGVQSPELKESKAALFVIYSCLHIQYILIFCRDTDGGEDMMAKRKRLQGKSVKTINSSLQDPVEDK